VAQAQPDDQESCVAAIAISLYSPGPRRDLTDLLIAGMRPAELRRHISADKWRQAERIDGESRALGVEAIPASSRRYPFRLRHIPGAPAALFVRAASHPWVPPDRMLAVVGTRAATVEVCAAASELSQELVEAGFMVVSGLALGVDGAAHRGALCSVPSGDRAGKGGTAAVLAHGLDRTYPPSHEPLAQEILSAGGALLSEHPIGRQPLRHHFLERNRIIAGMCEGVIVMQAGERSGSLVTARLAADFGRDVFVYIPDAVNEGHSGGLAMVEDGARPFVSASDVLREYGLVAPSPQVGEWEACSVEEYLSRHAISYADLLGLELQGQARRMPGNRVRYRRP